MENNQSVEVEENKKLNDERDALLRRFKEIHRQISVILKHYGFLGEKKDNE